MRERSLPIKTEKLVYLSNIHRPARIAASLDISRQRWHLYKTGENDMPESIIDKLCGLYNIDKTDLIDGSKVFLSK